MSLKGILNIKSPHVKKYLTNTSWIFWDYVLRQGFNIFIGIYVARYLKPEGFGSLSYASVYIQLLQPLAYIGLSSIIIRDLIKYKDKSNEILGTAFVFKLIASIVSLLIIACIAWSLNISLSGKWNIVVASISLLVSPLQIIDLYFQANVKAKYIAYAQQTSTILVGALKFFGVIMCFPLIWFVCMIVIEAVITSLMLAFFYKANKQEIKKWRFDKQVAQTFLKELLPFVFSGFFIVLYMKIDQLMIYSMLDATSLGIYTAAVKLCEPFYLIASLICSSLFPAIINGLLISREEYEHRLQRLFNMLTWLAIFVSLGIQLFANTIIQIIYGTTFAGAEVVLQIYFWASVFVFQGVIASQAYAAEKIQVYSTFYTFIGAIVNIALNLWLIPLIGVKGAALATLISYVISGVLLNVMFKQTRFVFKQQAYAYIAIFTKPKSLLSAFYASKNNTGKIPS